MIKRVLSVALTLAVSSIVLTCNYHKNTGDNSARNNNKMAGKPITAITPHH